MHLLKIFISLMTIALLLPLSYAEWPDRFGQEQQVSLQEIVERPEAWLNIPVQIHIRFAWLSEVYIPFRTHFNQERYLNFTAWDIQEIIWEAQGFNRPHIYFYVEKDNPELKTFLKLQTFDSVCILGKVEGLFAGKPFIRVVWCCRLPGTLDEHKLKLINNSLKLYRQRRFDEAIPMFYKILANDPPQDIESLLRKSIAQVYMNEKNAYEYAFVELKKAEVATPKDKEVQELLKECNYNLGSRADVLLEAWKEGLLKNTSMPTDNSTTINLNPEQPPTPVEPSTEVKILDK